MTRADLDSYFVLIRRLDALGVTREDATALLRIEKTLHNWAEQECGDGNEHASWSIERDETGKPFRVVHFHRHPYNTRVLREPIADREKGALRRLAAIMQQYPHLAAYHQTDPRGCALYICRVEDLEGRPIETHYMRGVAVCY